MKTNFREIIEISTPKLLRDVLGIKYLDIKQRKAFHNIKYCALDQWKYVDGFVDYNNKYGRKIILDAKGLFEIIYEETQQNIYAETFCGWGKDAENSLKDIISCEEKFLKAITLYFTAELLEEAVYEVDGTEEDAIRIAQELKEIKENIL